MSDTNSHDQASHNNLLKAYGLFLVTWSVFEHVLSYVIERDTSLSPLHAIIILSGLGFERKAGIARSLLALDPKNADAISTINRITQEAGRNALVHGQIFVGSNSLEFVKHKTDQSLKTSVRRFERNDLMVLTAQINELVCTLQTQLGIDDEILTSHAASAKNLWSKSATSPRPPSSTKTS